mgnify:CR=1 FL=1
MVYEFLISLSKNFTKAEIKEILEATLSDIKFNRILFGKKTSPVEFILICNSCIEAFLAVKRLKTAQEAERQYLFNGLNYEAALKEATRLYQEEEKGTMIYA